MAFIGLGHMGGPLRRRLAEAGLDLTVFDLDPARAAPALEYHARLAASAASAAHGAGVLITMLPTPAAVEDVLARSVGVPAELSAVVEQLFPRTRVVFGDDAGEMTPVRLYEETAGVLLRLRAPEAAGWG